MRAVPLALLLVVTGCPEYIEAETLEMGGPGGDTQTSSSSGSSSTTGATVTTAGTTDASSTASVTSSSTSLTTSTASDSSTSGCDGPCVAEQAPSGLSCTADCGYDFSQVPQWYCSGGCSPIGAPLGGDGCDQSDADLFCALLTGNPNATASPTEWGEHAVIDAPGFCCLNFLPELTLGPLVEYGLDDLCYTPDSMITDHEFGTALLAEDIVCVEP